MERPVVVVVGAALLGWVAGSMIWSDLALAGCSAANGAPAGTVRPGGRAVGAAGRRCRQMGVESAQPAAARDLMIE